MLAEIPVVLKSTSRFTQQNQLIDSGCWPSLKNSRGRYPDEPIAQDCAEVIGADHQPCRRRVGIAVPAGLIVGRNSVCCRW